MSKAYLVDLLDATGVDSRIDIYHGYRIQMYWSIFDPFSRAYLVIEVEDINGERQHASF